MPYLLNSAFAPITFTTGFLETDIETATRAFWDWQQELLPQGPPDTHLEKKRAFRRTQGCAEGTSSTEFPLAPPISFVPTRSPWVACFDNGWRGSDPVSIVSHLNTVIHCRGMLIKAAPETIGNTQLPGWQRSYAATALTLYGPELVNYRNVIRAIGVLHDGDRWAFHQEGHPFPFENTAQYTARTVRERFTPEMLQQYLQALGLDAFTESFYLPAGQSAVLIYKEGPLPPEVTTLSPDYSE